MLHLDWFRELMLIIGISIGTCVLAAVYAALENVFPFLKGGLAGCTRLWQVARDPQPVR